MTRVNSQVIRLQIPSGAEGKYRLAQLDDYESLPRRQFPWQPPVRLKIRARASARVIPGTWGFGFWNAPFTLGIVRGVERLRLPNLPNAAWFFFASPPNYLSLREDLPADGSLAALFSSPQLWAPLMALGAPVFPLMAIRPVARLLRRTGRQIVRQDAASLDIDPCEWHVYEIFYDRRAAVFKVDGIQALESRLVPRGRLGLVLWVDNQYAALPPDQRPGFGTLPNPEPAWIELSDLQVESR